MDSRLYRSALVGGFDDVGIKLGTVLGQGWFWFRRQGCRALVRAGMSVGGGGWVVGVFGLEARVLSTAGEFRHGLAERYVYRVCSVNGLGVMERNVRAAATVQVDGGGRLVNRPAGVFGLEARQVGPDVVVSWFYRASKGQSPVGFSIYGDGGSGIIDRQSAVGRLDFRGDGYYSVTAAVGGSGRYKFAVRCQGQMVSDYAEAFVEADIVTGQLAGADIMDVRVI